MVKSFFKITSFCAFVVMALSLLSCQHATTLTSEVDEIISSKQGETISVVLYSDASNFKVEKSPEWVDATM